MDKLDGELRLRAARYKGATAGEILSGNELSQVARMLDPETAAMVFYQSILESRFDKEFISIVNGVKLSAAQRELNRKTEVAFVPSAFSNSGLKWGADGEKILDGVRELGFQTETIETQQRNSLTENAVIIGNYLRECSAENVILISRNRASAEVRMLLQDRGPDAAEFQKLKGWVSVAGILDGSIEIDRIIKNKSNSVIEALANQYLRLKSRLRRESKTALAQACPDYTLWHREFKLPRTTSLVQVVGVSRPRHLWGFSELLAQQHAKVIGPSDGVLFLEESWIKLGLRYPIWGLNSGSNHLSFQNSLLRILLTMVESQKSM